MFPRFTSQQLCNPNEILLVFVAVLAVISLAFVNVLESRLREWFKNMDKIEKGKFLSTFLAGNQLYEV